MTSTFYDQMLFRARDIAPDNPELHHAIAQDLTLVMQAGARNTRKKVVEICRNTARTLKHADGVATEARQKSEVLEETLEEASDFFLAKPRQIKPLNTIEILKTLASRFEGLVLPGEQT